MVFSSIFFLLYFLPVFLLVYYTIGNLGRGTLLKNLIILLFSVFFYAWGAPAFVLVVVLTTLLDYFIVHFMHKSEVKRQKSLFLGLSIVINIGLLFYFKYANFFIENLNLLLGGMGMTAIHWTKIALPIGISFFTFQKLTYSVDVYRGVHAPLKNPLDYLLYIIMFPQLIAGPIVRFHTIADQIRDRKADVDDRLTGLYRFCIGLAKKVLIANVMGKMADDIFNGEIGGLDTGAAWIGILAYTFQIYFDFAGYSDMAIGIGRMTGFTFPENFDNPYTSGSITEFWRRWHITLGAWMRDYLYIPLGGNRVKSRSRLYFNLWVVFLLSGFWHGASWNFIIWGAWHGLFLILDRVFLADILKRIGKIPSVIFCFLVVVIGWVFFRLESFSDAWLVITKMFAFDFQPAGVKPEAEFWTIFVIAAIFSFVTISKWGKLMQDKVFALKMGTGSSIAMAVICVLLVIICVSQVTTENFNPFIYYRF